MFKKDRGKNATKSMMINTVGFQLFEFRSVSGTCEKKNEIQEEMPDGSSESTTIKIKETAHVNPL